MSIAMKRTFASALAIGLGLGLSACGGMPSNPSLYSTKQAVVERTNYTLDLRTGYDGLDVAEQQRLAGWFEAMDLRYGDRVSLEDPTGNPATRAAIGEIAGRHGILLSEGAPVTAGYVDPGLTRVVLTRSVASVPGCPDWSVQSDMNYTNGTHPGYGCSVNGNYAAMIANPEDLLVGQQGTGETVVVSSNKAIGVYREQTPTGSNGLSAPSTGGN